MSDDKVKPDVPKDINPIYNNSSSFSTKTNDDTTSNNYNNNQTNNEDNTDIDFDKLFLDDNNTNKDSDLKEDFDEDDNYHSCSEDENHGSVDDNEEWSEGMEEKEMNEEKGVIDEEALKLAESKLSEEEKEVKSFNISVISINNKKACCFMNINLIVLNPIIPLSGKN